MSYEKPPFGKGLTVDVRDGNVEKALKILKKKMANEGILREVRRRMEYEKPSEIRRRKKAEAVRRWRRKAETIEQW
jgi:small subunit ribosomal protein S21